MFVNALSSCNLKYGHSYLCKSRRHISHYQMASLRTVADIDEQTQLTLQQVKSVMSKLGITDSNTPSHTVLHTHTMHNTRIRHKHISNHAVSNGMID